MKAIFTLSVMLFLYSCLNLRYQKVEPIGQIVNNLPNCKNLPIFIHKNWYKHRTKNHYYCTENFRQRLVADFFDCLRDLDNNQIEQLFGIATEKDEIMMSYNIGESCEKPLRENCEILFFVFSGNGKVHSVSFQRTDLLK